MIPPIAPGGARPVAGSPRYRSAYRSHTCGALRSSNIGAEVTLCGAVDRSIDDKTFELRDSHGKTLVRLGPAAIERLTAQAAARPSPESTIQVTGRVVARERPDPAHATGEVLVDVPEEILVHNVAKAPVVIDFRDESLPSRERIRQRYVYLRKPAVHETFAFRTRVLTELRRFVAARRFVEAETPILGNRFTPDATEAFLAIREPGLAFALPTPGKAVHGDLLMAAGLDRTYEVARRFVRKKSYGPFEQPEFSVLELNMAYVGESDLISFEDAFFRHLFKAMLDEDVEVQEIRYDDAVVIYGSDSPDVRGVAVRDLSKLAQSEGLTGSGGIYAMVLPGKAGQVKELGDLKKLGDGKKVSVHWLTIGLDGRMTLFGTAPRGETLPDRVPALVGAAAGDLVLLVLATERGAGAALAGALRRNATKAFGFGTLRKHGLARVTRIPFLRPDPAGGDRSVPYADPLARHHGEELKGDPRHARALEHNLVLNGVKLGRGVVRNHDMQVQSRIFNEVLSFTPADVDARYGRHLRALRFGLPPHGRITVGIDRLVTLLRGLGSIDEVMALPKLPDGTDPLTRAPWPIEQQVVRGLFDL